MYLPLRPRQTLTLYPSHRTVPPLGEWASLHAGWCLKTNCWPWGRETPCLTCLKTSSTSITKPWQPARVPTQKFWGSPMNASWCHLRKEWWGVHWVTMGGWCLISATIRKRSHSRTCVWPHHLTDTTWSRWIRTQRLAVNRSSHPLLLPYQLAMELGLWVGGKAMGPLMGLERQAKVPAGWPLLQSGRTPLNSCTSSLGQGEAVRHCGQGVKMKSRCRRGEAEEDRKGMIERLNIFSQMEERTTLRERESRKMWQEMCRIRKMEKCFRVRSNVSVIAGELGILLGKKWGSTRSWRSIFAPCCLLLRNRIKIHPCYLEVFLGWYYVDNFTKLPNSSDCLYSIYIFLETLHL